MTCDDRSLYLDCLSCKCQKSCKNGLCHVAVPIYFDKESDNEQGSPISPSQGNLTTVSLSLSHWYPGSGVVLDCIDS